MIFSIKEILSPFLIIFGYPEIHILSLLELPHCINSPFLWNVIPHAILQIKQCNLFHAALCRFLF